jgi:hypothetical protein
VSHKTQLSCNVLELKCGGLLFDRHKPPLTRRSVVYYCSAVYIWLETRFAIAKQAGALRYEWARKGVTLTLTDTMIAATVLHYGLTLITDNRKDFPMPELKLHPLK